jgi:hypothetical protein
LQEGKRKLRENPTLRLLRANASVVRIKADLDLSALLNFSLKMEAVTAASR